MINPKMFVSLWTGLVVMGLAAGCASRPESPRQLTPADPGPETAPCCPGHTATTGDSTASAPSQPSAVIVITAAGDVMMNDQALDLSTLETTLAPLGASPDGIIRILAHPQAPFETVTQVAAHVRSTGYGRVSVEVGEP